jgi:hypothetical protein
VTFYEQLTIDGTVEVTDSATGEVKARRMTLTCEKPCRLCGEHFMEGEEIEVTFPAICDLDASRESGPWEPGGYTSRWIRHNALQIIEGSRDRIIFTVQV